jgi:FAD binding domain
VLPGRRCSLERLGWTVISNLPMLVPGSGPIFGPQNLISLSRSPERQIDRRRHSGSVLGDDSVRAEANSDGGGPLPESNSAVLVVGAGPTGLLLTAELLRRQVDCLLIDAHDAPLQWDRATVHERSIEVFEALGLAERLLDQAVASLSSSASGASVEGTRTRCAVGVRNASHAVAGTVVRRRSSWDATT